MTTTEDLALLLVEDARGRSLSSRTLEPAVGGALLLELLRSGALALAPSGVLPYRRTVTATGREPQDALLRRAVRMVAGPAGSGLPAVAAVERLGAHLTDAVLERLLRNGSVEHRTERVLGLVRVERWTVLATTRVEAARARLRSVLLEGAAPIDDDVVVLTVLAEIGRPVPLTGLGWSASRTALARARELTAQVPGRAAVRSAVLAAADGAGSAAVSA